MTAQKGHYEGQSFQHKVKAGQAAHLDGSLPLATHRCLRNVLPGNQLHKTLASGLRDKQVYTVTIFWAPEILA